MDRISNRMDITELMNTKEREIVTAKVNYWKAVGVALMDDDSQKQKWCNFVDELGYTKGMMFDEALQVLSMMKLKVPKEQIAEAVKHIPNGEAILRNYLSAFAYPGDLFEIRCIVNPEMKNYDMAAQLHR